MFTKIQDDVLILEYFVQVFSRKPTEQYVLFLPCGFMEDPDRDGGLDKNLLCLGHWISVAELLDFLPSHIHTYFPSSLPNGHFT